MRFFIYIFTTEATELTEKIDVFPMENLIAALQFDFWFPTKGSSVLSVLSVVNHFIESL